MDPPPAAFMNGTTVWMPVCTGHQVDLDDALERLEWFLGDCLAGRRDSGVVDQTVDRAELGYRVLGGGLPRRWIGDVEVNVTRCVAERFGHCSTVVVE